MWNIYIIFFRFFLVFFLIFDIQEPISSDVKKIRNLAPLLVTAYQTLSYATEEMAAAYWPQQKT